MTAMNIGFIGLGVMGEPMCRNLARKCGLPVTAFDLNPEPLARAAEDGVQTAASMADLVAAIALRNANPEMRTDPPMDQR